MRRRNPVLANNQIYHVFNRSIGKESIFVSRNNLSKALEIVNFYRFPQSLRLSKFKSLPQNLKQNYLQESDKFPHLVEIYCFAFMPNHYHFLIKQLEENGIRRFVSNFQNSFAKVFNLKNRRDGALFQNSFKAKIVETDEQFMHLSRYIHLNPVTAFLIEFADLKEHPWTSFPMYVSNRDSSFVNSDFLLGMFKFKQNYSQFAADQVDYQRNLAKIKELIIE